MQFTQDQQKVINARNKNVLVSAAAGSGKTAVLVERIMSRITDKDNPIDVDKLLIVTFTNAAAAEMRQRINKAILERLAKEPDNAHLQKQSALIHNAMITTIDSFCLFLLRNHFHELSIDPSFRIGDPGEIKLLMQEVLEEVLEKEFEDGAEDFLYLVEVLSPDGKDGNLEDQILRLYTYAQSSPYPEKWLAENNALLFGTKQLYELALGNFRDGVELADKLLQICEQADGPYMYADALECDKAFFEDATKKLEAFGIGKQTEDFANQREALYTLLHNLMSGLKFATLSSKKDSSVSGEKRDLIKNLRDYYKKSTGKIQEMVATEDLSILQKHEDMADKLRAALVRVTLHFSKALMDRKLDKNVLDFSDIEHLALSLLLQDGQLTETAKSYRDFYEEIMIDEYQDSNMVQEMLLSSLAKCEGDVYDRFMVGDMKQSIYSFRQARPDIFLEKYETYTEEDSQNKLICLKQNFRSREEVLDSVNEVFRHVLRPEIGGITYSQDAWLYPGADYPVIASAENSSPYITEICLGELSDATVDKRTLEAAMVAEKIKSMVGHFDVVDTSKSVPEGEEKPLKKADYRDIVILVRSMSGMGETLKEILSREEIPVYLTLQTGYFGAMEVQLLLQFFKVLANPYEDISFVAVMNSMFWNFTDEETGFIRVLSDKKESFYEAFRRIAYPNEEDIERRKQLSETLLEKYAYLQQKVTDTLEELEMLREEAVVNNMTQLLLLLLKRYRFMEYVQALPGGEQRRANIEMLLEKTIAFEKSSYHGLFHFIRYMDQLSRYEVDDGEAGTLSENANVVRIMTIHKSKGLEFPICFVCGTDKKYNLRDTSNLLLLDEQWGAVSGFIDKELHVSGTTLSKQLLAEKMKRSSLGEELRVLYVAMTRAKEKLILTGCMENVEEKLGMLTMLASYKGNPLPTSMLASANCNLDFVKYAYALSPEKFQLTITQESDLACLQEKEVIEKINARELWEKMSEQDVSELLADDQKDLLEELKKRFAFVYPYENLAHLYTKTSVSELKKAAMDDADVHPMFETDDHRATYVPAFAKEEVQSSGTSRGSAFHRVLELLDFASYEELSDEQRRKKLAMDMEQFVAKERLSAEYKELVSANKLLKFLRSDVAKRMMVAQKAGKLYREKPFLMAVPANQVNPDFPETENILVQGVIDVYFQEEDGIVILDYKTDRVTKVEQLLERYQTQLDYYEGAVERLTQIPVKEKVLYSFAMDEELAWK